MTDPFTQALLDAEGLLRLGAFAAVFAAMALAEAVWPWRAADRRRRWTVNLGLALVNSLLLRIAGPLALTALAVATTGAGFGLITVMLLPDALALAMGLIVFDLAIYAQHRAFHAVPVLWRLHAVHHDDEALDASSALRFHPGEMVVSWLWKAAVIVAFGIPPLAVLAAEILLNAAALAHHANVALPPALERHLSRWVITPGLHRIHHSQRQAETDSNFGAFHPLWDRLFGTWRGMAEGTLVLGLGPGAASSGLGQSLLRPFRTATPAAGEHP